MVTVVLGTIVAAFVVATLLLYKFPEFTKRWIGRIKAARKAVFVAFAVLAGGVLVASGQPFLMLWGGVIYLGIAIAALDGWLGEKIGVEW